MSARKRNPRRAILPTLKSMRANVARMLGRWDIRMQIYDLEIRTRRPRTEAEKPENDLAEWCLLIEFMEAIERQAASIRRFAAERITELEGR